MKRFLQGVSILFVVMVLIAVVVETTAAQPGKPVPQKGGGRGGGGGGGGGGDDNTGPWPVSVMFGDAAGDRIRSDGTMYVDGVHGIDAFIRSGGDLQVELGGKNALRHVVYDFSGQTRVGQCEIDGNCNCLSPVLMEPPFIGDDNGGWLRVNMLDGEAGMHELAVGSSSGSYYTSSIPGLGTQKKDRNCTVRSEARKGAPASAATVRVTRTSATEWLIESLVPHTPEYVDDPISNAIDHGSFDMPFSITVSCLDANVCPGDSGS